MNASIYPERSEGSPVAQLNRESLAAYLATKWLLHRRSLASLGIN
jgi:hypothetical protein